MYMQHTLLKALLALPLRVKSADREQHVKTWLILGVIWSRQQTITTRVKTDANFVRADIKR
jgi:hypothetical protein